jgi:hypothetical protein
LPGLRPARQQTAHQQQRGIRLRCSAARSTVSSAAGQGGQPPGLAHAASDALVLGSLKFCSKNFWIFINKFLGIFYYLEYLFFYIFIEKIF